MTSGTSTPFAGRQHLFTQRVDAQRVAHTLQSQLAANQHDQVRSTVSTLHPADLADVMIFLTDKEDVALFRLLDVPEAAEVLDEVDDTTRAALLLATPPDRLAAIVDHLQPDEGADILGMLPDAVARQVLQATAPATAKWIQSLLPYPPTTAGGLMSSNIVVVPSRGTQADALARLREQPDAEISPFVFVTDDQGIFRGMVSLQRLLLAAPNTPVADLLMSDVITVPPTLDQEQVTNIFARYDLLALPVVGPDPERRLLGVISSDDVIDVLQALHASQVAHLAGSDAQELERKSPFQVAKLRMPWIMATMFIELLAGFVIRVFNGTLEHYILLASFMPIISAISGNTGLQSAAIIIRGLSSGLIQLAHWRHALARQVATTALLGGACGVVLGAIGAIWSRNVVFGLVILLGMFAAVNIAGIVGTVVPLLSKRAGFDPALTAGPFETAFQDVVGISIFLGLATALLGFLH